MSAILNETAVRILIAIASALSVCILKGSWHKISKTVKVIKKAIIGYIKTERNRKIRLPYAMYDSPRGYVYDPSVKLTDQDLFCVKCFDSPTITPPLIRKGASRKYTCPKCNAKIKIRLF